MATSTSEEKASAYLEQLKTAITAGQLRIEFSIAFTSTGSVPTATLYTKNERNRWVKQGPFITPEDGGDRGDLLDTLAGLHREATREAE